MNGWWNLCIQYNHCSNPLKTFMYLNLSTDLYVVKYHSSSFHHVPWHLSFIMHACINHHRSSSAVMSSLIFHSFMSIIQPFKNLQENTTVLCNKNTNLLFGFSNFFVVPQQSGLFLLPALCQQVCADSCCWWWGFSYILGVVVKS